MGKKLLSYKSPKTKVKESSIDGRGLFAIKPIKRTWEEISDKGLGYVDFQIEPHINSPHFPKRTFEAAYKQSQTISDILYAIDDNTAIKIVNKKVIVVSEGM